MDAFAKARIGSSDLQVTRLGFGGASLGDMRAVLPEPQAEAAIAAGHTAGIGYFDTSPWYGNGKSELRLGHVLRTCPRDSFVLSTKIGRVHRRPDDPDNYRHPAWAGGLPFEPSFDYTADGVHRSYDMSLARLGLNRVEALLIHDLDPGMHGSEESVDSGFAQLDGGGYQALADLKTGGEIRAIGAGINVTGMIPRFLERFELDFFLVAMPYTLLDQAGLEELDLCADRGVSVVIGSPFASGILARGPSPDATYGYRRVRPEMLEKAERIQAACQDHDVPLAAAALQFLFGHRAVAAVVPGPVSAEEVRLNLAAMRHAIPAGLWQRLRDEGLVQAGTPLPGLD